MDEPAPNQTGGSRDPTVSRQIARDITASVLQAVPGILDRSGASALLVYLEALAGQKLEIPAADAEKVIYVTRAKPEQVSGLASGGRILRVPDVPLTRMGQIKVAIFLALSRDLVRPGDVVVFLSGVADSGTLDTVLITEVGREFETYAASESGDELPADVLPEVIDRVVDLAVELGQEGREGKAVGALFVVGDAERVQSLSRPLILNPFSGYHEDQRNLLADSLRETLKEFSTLDGAFIVRGDGVVESCGVHLKTASQGDFELPRGLGTRHHAAAAITAVTDAVAVTVSESTGTVMVFRHGRPITEIEKPRQSARQRRAFLRASAGGPAGQDDSFRPD